VGGGKGSLFSEQAAAVSTAEAATMIVVRVIPSSVHARADRRDDLPVMVDDAGIR
jgi:hypothetical protein